MRFIHLVHLQRSRYLKTGTALPIFPMTCNTKDPKFKRNVQ